MWTKGYKTRYNKMLIAYVKLSRDISKMCHPDTSFLILCFTQSCEAAADNLSDSAADVCTHGRAKSDNKRQPQISRNKSDRGSKRLQNKEDSRRWKQSQQREKRKCWGERERGARRRARRMREGHRRMEHRDISNSSPEEGGDTVLRIAAESCPQWLQH